MSTKLNFILLIIVFIFLAALVSRTGSLALLAIPFLVYLGTGLWFAPLNVKLHVRRSINSLRNNENIPIKVNLFFENIGGSIPLLQVIDSAKPGMNLLEGSLVNRLAISSEQKFELNYTIRVPRGHYEWQTIKVIASDPFGLFTNIQFLPAEANTLVLPEQVNLKRFNFHPKPTVRTAGPYLSRMAGSGIDFWGVREYHQGDSMRLLNWRKTARNPQCFFSNEFEREEMADIGLLLDARTVTNLPFGTENLFDYSVMAAATLSKFFLSSGNRVSMLLLSDYISRVFPGYGKRQLVRILDILAGCTLGERVTLDTIKYIPGRLFPSHSVIIIISPLHPQDFSTIARLHTKGYQLLLVSPSTGKNSLTGISKSSFDYLSIRTAKIEREVLIRRFQQIGIQVIDWNVDQPLIKILHAAQFIQR